jgi:probable F420-dependent oxidoreductase
MKAGLFVFPTQDTPDPAELARIAEGEGFESLWFPEHTHIPAVRATPWPMGRGELPPEYSRTYDLFTALAFAASSTTTLRIGSAICLAGVRDPIVTAKAVASLDVLSAGRVELGVGAGWNREELAHHGVPFARRMRHLVEHVEAMQAIWADDEASYAGETVAFERVWCGPKPVRPGGVPIHVGGDGPTVEERVLRLGAGWIPNVAGPDGDDALLARVTRLRARAGDRTVPITVNLAPKAPRRLATLAASGIDRVLFYLPSGGADVLRPRIAHVSAALRAAGS